MKTIILLFMAGQLQTVSAPQFAAAPDAAGLAQYYLGQTHLIYAHSSLSGTEFYNLAQGDIITAYYSDGSTTEYQVTRLGAYSARSTAEAIRPGNIDLRDGENWVGLLSMIERYTIPGGITLSTCYAADKGMGIVTGRLFIETHPVNEVEQYDHRL